MEPSSSVRRTEAISAPLVELPHTAQDALAQRLRHVGNPLRAIA